MNGNSIGFRIYCVAISLYPREFRREYGNEMREFFTDWRACEVTGFASGLRFVAMAGWDLVQGVSREWVAVAAEKWDRSARKSIRESPPWVWATVAGAAVFMLYALTLAPTVAFWDAGEYMAAAHVLGIPHPPGSPLFVLLARSWELILAPLGWSTAVRMNLFSAFCSAVAHTFWFLVVARAIAVWAETRRFALLTAAIAVLVSATAFTVWNQSNVNEKIYTISLATTAIACWMLLRWRDLGHPPKRLLAAIFLVALSSTNHLMGVLVAPAALLFALLSGRGKLLNLRLAAGAVTFGALALSVHLFLPIRVEQRPIISEGEPRCESVADAAASIYSAGVVGCEALSANLAREQYAKPPITADPNNTTQPRGRALFAAQLANYAQYFNWQWSRGLSGIDPVLGGERILITLLFLALGLAGYRVHLRADRQSALMLGTLFLTLSLGLVVYLNFRFGYTIGVDRFPDRAMHEVRERDYFFLVGFSVWGLWVGMGIVQLWRKGAAWLGDSVGRPYIAASPLVAIALLPLALNWNWASRADDHTARDWAYNLLLSVEPYGVLFTNGDNDTFPLWYLQEVEGLRQDVTVIVSPYLSTAWYVDHLRASTEPCPEGVDPARAPTVVVCQRPFDPADIPAPLAQLGWTEPAAPPRDSIIPYSRDEIEEIADDYFVTSSPLAFKADRIEAEIVPGTLMLPSDLFTAAIIQNVAGERPIHIMPGMDVSTKLGLADHTIRQGLIWKLHDGAALPAQDERLRYVPEDSISPTAGAAVDVVATDTLFWEVYRRSGRILNPARPWSDHSTLSIPFQYVAAHLAAAEAYSLVGDVALMNRHMDRLTWWERVIGG